jgi:hypothetical protein
VANLSHADAWSRRQYDTAQDKLDEAISILDETYRDEKTTFQNRPMHWQRSEAGQAEEARLIVMDNLIQELHAAAETISGLQPASSEPPLSRRAPTAATPKP